MKAENVIFLWNALSGARHQDYDKVKKYAEKLKHLNSISKDANAHLLEQFIKRESKDDFNQRVSLTRLTTAALINRIMTPFNKAIRPDNVTMSIGNKDVQAVSDTFNGKQTLFSYLTEKLHRDAFIDPNAFLLITILPFDSNIERASSAPKIIPSADVWDFTYDHTQLTKAVFRIGAAIKCYSYAKDSNASEVIIAEEVRENAASSFFEPQILQTQIETFTQMVSLLGKNDALFVKAAGKHYRITMDTPKVKGIQAHRIGYIPDVETDGRTCVVPYHIAIPRIESMIKGKSELDLSISLHVFAQKIQQVQACKGSMNEGGIPVQCNRGYEQGSTNICKNCNGTGTEPIATSAMDVITVQMGKSADDDHDLDNIVRYLQTDVQTPKFLADHIEAQEVKVVQDVFPSKKQEKSTVTTATEITVDQQDIQDVLMPYNRNIERLWTFCMDVACQIRDVIGAEFSIRYQDDLDIKTLSELLIEYKESVGMPVGVRRSIRQKISRKLSASDSKAEKREAIRIVHEPFGDKSPDEIKYLISQNLVSVEDKILWANYDKIMDKLERNNMSFLMMEYQVREKLITAEVDAIKTQIAPAQPV